MWVVPDQFKVRIGGNLYQNVPNLVVYKEENLFRLERSVSDGILGVDFDIYNGQGKKVATSDTLLSYQAMNRIMKSRPDMRNIL